MSFGNKDANEVVLICWIVARCNGNISGGLVMIVYFYPSKLGCTNDGHRLNEDGFSVNIAAVATKSMGVFGFCESEGSTVTTTRVLNVNAAIVSTASVVTTYPDAKSMFAAIKTRFRGNAATKKTHKTLLKQQYENFSASSAESLDSIFNRLQKIVSRLAILGVVISQEDLNSKILSSLPPE
ncbi:hypothetical protein Tco_1087548 [Tanacetum coccineum]